MEYPKEESRSVEDSYFIEVILEGMIEMLLEHNIDSSYEDVLFLLKNTSNSVYKGLLFP